jgi:hypothetical protein
MFEHYLPNFDKEKSKAYTPNGIGNWFKKAIETKNGDIEAVFKDKHQNKNLLELYHISFLALAIKKWINKEYYMYPCDTPDCYFLDIETNEAFPVELMELYFPDKNFDGDYEKLAKHIFSKKGHHSFPTGHLLISSRLDVVGFNVSELFQEMKRFNWNFERIWLSIFTNDIQQWTFFDFFSATNPNDKNYITFNLEKDKKFFY